MDQKFTLGVPPGVDLAPEVHGDDRIHEVHGDERAHTGDAGNGHTGNGHTGNGHSGNGHTGNGDNGHGDNGHESAHETRQDGDSADEAGRFGEVATVGIPVQRAEQAVPTGIVKAGRGRPSLGGQGRSPQVTFRAPPALRAKAEERAARDGKTVSQLAREAFEMYLTS